MGDKKKAAKGDKAKAGDKKQKKTKQAAPEAMTGAHLVEELREAGVKLVAAANSPAGREAIAVGLSIAATAAQAALTAKRQTKPAHGKKADIGGAKPGAANTGSHEAVAAALGGVAETVLSRLLGAKRG